MDSKQKKRAVVSYENMSQELAAAFAEKYPKGFNDYFPDLVKYDKPDGTSFYAVTLEIPDAIYLVKIKVKTDDAEDIAAQADMKTVMMTMIPEYLQEETAMTSLTAI